MSVTGFFILATLYRYDEAPSSTAFTSISFVHAHFRELGYVPLQLLSFTVVGYRSYAQWSRYVQEDAKDIGSCRSFSRFHVLRLFNSLCSVLASVQFLKRRRGNQTRLVYCGAPSTCSEIKDGRCSGHVALQFIRECNNKCQCAPNCPNRVVQRGLKTTLEVSER